MALLGGDAARLLDGVIIASIGEITTAAAVRHGLDVTVTARVSTLPGLIESLEAHLAAAP